MIGLSLRAVARLAAATALLGACAFAQLPSNASLKGAYYVRYLGEDTRTTAAMSFSGTITFDGAGKYTITGAGANSKTSDKLLKFSASGTYNIYSNGMVSIDNPFDTSGTASAPIYGGLGNGIVTGSSTEGAYLDTFIAISAATAGSNSTLNGSYNVASLEYLNGSFTQTRQTFFSMNADGAGGLGSVTIKGTAQSLADAATVQTSAAATYTVTANGTGTMNLPAPSGVAAGNVLLSGNKVLYASADGSLFIAGGATTYDLVVGTKAAPGASFDGIYFSAYMQNYATGSNVDGVYAVSGATNAINALSRVIAHERTNSENYYPYDYTYSDSFQFSANGVSSNGNQALGAGGNVMLAGGSGGVYELALYVKSVPMSTTGAGAVFLNPQGVVNTANYVPFTAQFSPGEFVTLFGSGFTNQTAQASALPFPTTLGGVQLSISYNDSTGKATSVNAPLYVVSPGQISGVIPYTVPGDGTPITFAVTYNGTKSNGATVYSGPSSPGVFTLSQNGLGAGAVQHADFTTVTSASPAKSGETIIVYMSGLGAVNGGVTAGSAAPANPLPQTSLPAYVSVIGSDGKYYDGTVVYSGLTPNLAGLYQINVTLPAGLPTGTAVLSIYIGDGTDYGDVSNEQSTIVIGK